MLCPKRNSEIFADLVLPFWHSGRPSGVQLGGHGGSRTGTLGGGIVFLWTWAEFQEPDFEYVLRCVCLRAVVLKLFI